MNTDVDSLAQILERINKQPADYFGKGSRTLEVIEAFLVGYQFGLEFPDKKLPFTHFTRWVAATYRVPDEAKNAFTLIREHVGGDETLAYDEFFRLLPAYAKDMAEKGTYGISKWYGQVMIQLRHQT